mgnify:CR=1 FL=1
MHFSMPSHCRSSANIRTQLLKDTELEIARIALDTGFATVQHFSRVFSNIAGVSPRKYRQQNSQSAASGK